MLVNIWATVVHLSDNEFSGANDAGNASLDLLISKKLRQRITHHHQTWMINPVWRSPGTMAVLLRDSYEQLRDSKESRLMLITPGFADIIHNVPLNLVRNCLDELGYRARF